MFVVVDIEWAINEAKQITAVKIDEECREALWFSSYINLDNQCVSNLNNHCEDKVNCKDFLKNSNIFQVMGNFEKWLGEDGILLFWHRYLSMQYEKIYKALFEQECPRKCMFLSKYVTEKLNLQWNEQKNPYSLAKECGIPLLKSQYALKDNIQIILQLMQKAQIQLSELGELEQKIQIKSTVCTPYQYDEEEKCLHKKGCSYMISGHAIRGFLRIEDCLKEKFKPCKYCMEKEWLQARIKKNVDTINRSQYNYVYIQDSKIFHKRTCGLIYKTEKQILGTTFYQSAIKNGKMPCKICQPPRLDRSKLVPLEKSPKKEKKEPKVKQPSKVLRAINRHIQINKERNSLFHIQNLTEQEKQDVYTLTQPEFSFWTAMGFSTFHLRSCPKLIKMSHYKGFKQYNQAIKSGYRPCKTCKPTAKYDTLLSIPFESKAREGEGIEQLITWCQQKSYQYVEKESVFFIKTPVGEWNVYMKKRPVQLEHSNLITGGGFHSQPRIFLSLYDAFFYIHRHDKSLMQKMGFNTKRLS